MSELSHIAPPTQADEPAAPRPRGDPLVVLLHGFMGTPEDLAPFARSLGARAEFVFPPGGVDLEALGSRGRAWWAIDTDARAAAIARGPRDLSTFEPDGREDAVRALQALLDRMAPDGGGRPLVLGGFSQGAMLACDFALRIDRQLAGLALFSGARICQDQWGHRYAGRAGLPTFMSHGRRDHDLSFEAAERLQQTLAASAWKVTWCPFDGGHEIPLVAWRAFKRWLLALSKPQSA